MGRRKMACAVCIEPGCIEEARVRGRCRRHYTLWYYSLEQRKVRAAEKGHNPEELERRIRDKDKVYHELSCSIWEERLGKAARSLTDRRRKEAERTGVTIGFHDRYGLAKSKDEDGRYDFTFWVHLGKPEEPGYHQRMLSQVRRLLAKLESEGVSLAGVGRRMEVMPFELAEKRDKLKQVAAPTIGEVADGK